MPVGWMCFSPLVLFICHSSPNSQLSWPGGLPSIQGPPEDLGAEEEEEKKEVDAGDDVISKASKEGADDERVDEDERVDDVAYGPMPSFASRMVNKVTLGAFGSPAPTPLPTKSEFNLLSLLSFSTGTATHSCFQPYNQCRREEGDHCGASGCCHFGLS